MSNVPQDLRYTKEHEWCRVEGDVATVGITQHAADQLGDVVFVELPKVGANLRQGATFGVVESVKAVSDLYSPLTGEVVEVNGPLLDSPSTINEQPYEGGWLLKVRIKDAAELGALLDAAAYGALIAG